MICKPTSIATIAFMGLPFATGAMACTLMDVTQKDVVTGEQCSKYYADPDMTPQSVHALPAEDLGHGVIRQIIGSGGCGFGESIVAYVDCDAGTAVWIGGKNNGGAPQPVAKDGEYIPPVIDEGVVGGFIGTQEAAFAPGYDGQAILAAARRLDWVDQTGELAQTKVTVEGRAFDLSCGCQLFYPNGVN